MPCMVPNALLWFVTVAALIVTAHLQIIVFLVFLNLRLVLIKAVFLVAINVWIVRIETLALCAKMAIRLIQMENVK